MGLVVTDDGDIGVLVVGALPVIGRQPGDHPAHIQIGVLRGLLDGGKHAVAAGLKHQKKDPGLGRLDLVVECLQVDFAVRAGEPYGSWRGRGRRGKRCERLRFGRRLERFVLGVGVDQGLGRRGLETTQPTVILLGVRLVRAVDL